MPEMVESNELNAERAEKDRPTLPESVKKHYGRGGAGNIIPSTSLDSAETMAHLEDEGNKPLRTPYFGFGRNGAGNMIKFTSRQEAEAFLKEEKKQKGPDQAPTLATVESQNLMKTPYFGYGRNGAGNMAKFSSVEDATRKLSDRAN